VAVELAVQNPLEELKQFLLLEVLIRVAAVEEEHKEVQMAQLLNQLVAQEL
jgi:hypothetical protein